MLNICQFYSPDLALLISIANGASAPIILSSWLLQLQSKVIEFCTIIMYLYYLFILQNWGLNSGPTP
jgi:hypothetical protein